MNFLALLLFVVYLNWTLEPIQAWVQGGQLQEQQQYQGGYYGGYFGPYQDERQSQYQQQGHGQYGFGGSFGTSYSWCPCQAQPQNQVQPGQSIIGGYGSFDQHQWQPDRGQMQQQAQHDEASIAHSPNQGQYQNEYQGNGRNDFFNEEQQQQQQQQPQQQPRQQQVHSNVQKQANPTSTKPEPRHNSSKEKKDVTPKPEKLTGWQQLARICEKNPYGPGCKSYLQSAPRS